jgi:anti-sigma-K factor RskA
MIPEPLQDQAALYALGLLEAEEMRGFEDAMHSSAELRLFVREMREASADFAQMAPPQAPPAALKQRVLHEVALEKQNAGAKSTASRVAWLPWAIAALFMIFCGILLVDRARLREQTADILSQVTFVTLGAPSPDQPTTAKATVVWNPGQQTGVITIDNMPPAGPGRDYQLWAVDANHKDPINAGLIRIDPNGVTRVRFKPDQSATQIKAFAISLEREGGVPKREGPIVLIGKA